MEAECVHSIELLGLDGSYIANNRTEGLRRGPLKTERQQKSVALEAALSEIRGLRDRIPICASCRMVRDDDGV